MQGCYSEKWEDLTQISNLNITFEPLDEFFHFKNLYQSKNLKGFQKQYPNGTQNTVSTHWQYFNIEIVSSRQSVQMSMIVCSVSQI